MEEYKIKVYVKVDSNNVVTEINSSVFIADLSGWIYIDEGTDGEEYARAQVNYLEKGLIDNDDKYNYKLVDGKLVELAEEEKEKLFPTKKPQLTEIEQLKQQVLETQNIIAQIQYNSLLNTK